MFEEAELFSNHARFKGKNLCPFGCCMPSSRMPSCEKYNTDLRSSLVDVFRVLLSFRYDLKLFSYRADNYEPISCNYIF